MKPLSAQLKSIENTWREPESPLPMQQPGLISSDGRLTMIPSLSSQDISDNPPSERISPADSTSCEMPLGRQQMAENLISELVSLAWGMFPLYGDDGSTLPLKIKVFQRVLAGYSPTEINDGFDEFFKTATNFPVPADIIKIIDPPTEKLSTAAYISIKKRQAQGEYIWDDREKNFLIAYENQEYGKVRGGSDELREAQRQIANYKSLEIEG